MKRFAKVTRAFTGTALAMILALALAGCDALGLGELGGRSNPSSVKHQAPFNIQLKGGNGDTGDGGDGGYFYAYTYGMKGVQLVRERKEVDTSFELPPEGTPDYGDNPLVVTSNLTIDAYADQPTAQGAVADGDYYMFIGSSSIWLRDSVNGDSPVTGLYVAPGRTLTLGLNYNWAGNTGQDTARVFFSDDVRIDGTLTVKSLDTGTLGGGVVENRHGAPATSADSGLLWCRGYRIWVNGTVDTSGDDAAPGSDERGGDGGQLYLYANNGAYVHGRLDASGGNGDGAGEGGHAALYPSGNGYIEVYTTSGVVVTTGAHTLDASGGNGSTGGNGGNVYIYADYHWFNTARITSNGGTGTDGPGGDAGYMYFEADYGSIYSSGVITAVGGDAHDKSGGGPYSAGDGNDIDFYPGYDEYHGELAVSGLVDASGGNSDNGRGGDGGEIEYYLYGSGEVRSSATLRANGGNGAGAGSWGGDAGGLYVYKYAEYDAPYGEYTMPGDLILTGPLSFNGGNGDNGGDGGYLDLYNDDEGDSEPPDFGILLYGYWGIIADGGNGGNDGGDGGYLEAYTEDAWIDEQEVYYPAGPVVIETNFYGRGGNGTNGWGGTGGYFEPEAEGEVYAGFTNTIVDGDVVLSGGNGGSGGGWGGWMYIYGYNLVEINGDLVTNGGDGTGANADGGGGEYIEIYSTYDLIINGNIISYGGRATGTGTGGEGGMYHYFEAGGQTIVNGNIDIRGGAADMTSGTGGEGGYVWMTSEWHGTEFNGMCWLSGGSAATPGVDGELWIDGSFIAGDD